MGWVDGPTDPDAAAKAWQAARLARHVFAGSPYRRW
jgi:hypothetical protein